MGCVFSKREEAEEIELENIKYIKRIGLKN
jgi:hypothetical protein